jgi:hypothetical protein
MLRSVLRTMFAAAVIASVSVHAAGAAQVVNVNVPVDLENLSPNVTSLSVGCHFTVGSDMLTSYSPNRFDKNISGSYKGTVTVPLTWDGTPPAPTGYRCQLYLFTTGVGIGFQPMAKDAKPGSTLVTDVHANFSAPILMPLRPHN